MALNDDAVFTAAKGYVFVADIPTTGALATRPTAATIAAFDEDAGLGTGWVDLGHTDREDLPEFGFEGGDTETRGTWRAAALKEVITEAAVDYVVVTLSQFDDEALSMYYGQANDPEAPAGEFVVMDSTTSTIKKSMCIVIEDGDYRIGFYSPQVSIRREDSIELATDEFAKMPLRMTFLKKGGVDAGGKKYPMFSWINEDTINPV